MRDHLGVALAEELDLAHREALAELQQRASAITSTAAGLRRKLMLRLVVTASSTRPIAESTTA